MNLQFTTYSRDCIDGECEDCDLAECQCDCHRADDEALDAALDAAEAYDRSWGY